MAKGAKFLFDVTRSQGRFRFQRGGVGGQRLANRGARQVSAHHGTTQQHDGLADVKREHEHTAVGQQLRLGTNKLNAA